MLPRSVPYVPIEFFFQSENLFFVFLQVGGKKREPDDKLYNTHEVLRHKVARGNTILYVHDTEKNLLSYHCVVFALRKFTGGMGDEDEDQPDSNKTWLNYFLKPLGKYSTV